MHIFMPDIFEFHLRFILGSEFSVCILLEIVDTYSQPLLLLGIDFVRKSTHYSSLRIALSLAFITFSRAISEITLY